MSDIEFSKEIQAPQGIKFETKKIKQSAAEEDESLNLEMIRKWEETHPSAKRKPLDESRGQNPPK